MPVSGDGKGGAQGLRILFVGDVVGKPGRRALAAQWSALREEYRPDVVIVNAENAAGGLGLTPAVADELFGLGVDVLTLGNHAWDKKDIITYIDAEAKLIRPANFPPGSPGAGWCVTTVGEQRIAVVNLIGRVGARWHYDDPFRTADAVLAALPADVKIVFVDMHAEATSEKMAMAWYLDGRVSAVVGTHTHVQTNDGTILPGGTAYLTDAGMTGPYMSVIGADKDLAIERFLSQMPLAYQVADGPSQVACVFIDIDDATGQARQIVASLRREDRQEHR